MAGKTEIDASPAGSAHRRRRRAPAQAKAKLPPVGPLRWIRTPAFGRGILAVMMLVSAGYIWQTWQAVQQARTRLGPVALGMNESEVRAVLGGPISAGKAGAELLFGQDGRHYAVQLNRPDRQVSAVSCLEQQITSPACPALLGVRIGDERRVVLSKLGAGQVRRAGSHEIWAYPQIGAAFDLRDGQVTQITLRADALPEPPWQMLLWRLVP